MASALLQDALHECFLALGVVDLLDAHAGEFGLRTHMLGDTQTQGVGVALGVVEQLDPSCPEMLFHGSGPADGFVSAKQHHAIKAFDHAFDVLGKSLSQWSERIHLPVSYIPALFGSGFAGLGQSYERGFYTVYPGKW